MATRLAGGGPEVDRTRPGIATSGFHGYVGGHELWAWCFGAEDDCRQAAEEKTWRGLRRAM